MQYPKSIFIFLSLSLFLCTQLDAQHRDSLYTFGMAEALYPVLNRETKVVHTPVPAYVKGVSSPTLSLNGEWQFSSAVGETLDGLAHPAQGWKPMPVPSEWYMEGERVTPGTWAGYSKRFTLPADWKGSSTLIRFGAVESECRIYLNGRYVGEHIGSMTQFERNLTPFLKQGENSLLVYVRSESLASGISKISHYAKHQVGGLLRGVSLIALPPKHITDLYADAQLSDNLEQGRLTLHLSLSQQQPQAQVEVCLRERGIEGLPSQNREVYRHTGRLKDLKTIAINAPTLWHAEAPFLYTLEVSLYEKGVRSQTVMKNIGFRKIARRGNVLEVNHRPVKLRGVARHDITAYAGRALRDTSLLRHDIAQLRNANCNFIRTSHYPPDSYMLDLCDRYGLFVEDEAPVCWEAGKDTLPKIEHLFYTFKSMLVRDRSHPCILIWSLGNESDWKPKFYPGLLLGKEFTNGIPVKFSHSETHGIIKATDIGTKHYPGWKGLMAYENYFRPITFGEALHLNCYNSSENMTDPGLRDMWGDYLKHFVDFMQDSPSIAGLGIWGCTDEVFIPRNNAPVGYGPWGVVDGFRREKPEFWHMKMAYSPIVVTSRHFESSERETFVSLENRYNTQNGNEVDMIWKDGNEQGVAQVEIAPGKQGTLRLPHVMKGDTLTLTVRDRRGFDLSVWNIPRTYSPYYTLPELSGGAVQLATTDSTYCITSARVTYRFCRKTGTLCAIQKGDRELITAPVSLYAIPHLKENEVIDYIPQERVGGEIRFTSDPLLNWTFQSEQVACTSQGISLTVCGRYGEHPVELVYTFDGNDRLRIDYILNIFKLGNGLRQIGIGLNLPGEYTTLDWKRKGLWSTYPNDHIGRPNGTAQAFYPETCSRYLEQHIVPTHPFSRDGNAYGSNDFRSTKQQLIAAQFSNEKGDKIAIESNGKQHLRAWVVPRGISFLVANYSDSGNEFYLNYDANRTKYLDAYLAEDGDVAGWLQLKFK